MRQEGERERRTSREVKKKVLSVGKYSDFMFYSIIDRALVPINVMTLFQWMVLQSPS